MKSFRLSAWHCVAPDQPDADASWFIPAQQLRGIKHRYLNPTTCYALAAAMACQRQGQRAVPDERRGLFLGTTVADFAVRHEFDAQVLAGGAEALNTVSAPNISANIAAAHVAIACRARAFATTLTSPMLPGFEALYLGLQALAIGQADQVLAIAAEQSLPPSAGCCVLPGALAMQLDVCTDGDPGPRLEALAWGCDAADGGQAALQLQQALQERLAPGMQARLVCVRDPSIWAAAVSARCAAALHGLLAYTPKEAICSSPGALAPVLHAVQAASADHPTALLGIHERRYVAFLIHPSTLSTHQEPT